MQCPECFYISGILHSASTDACKFKQESYPALKELFEQPHSTAGHFLVLKPRTVVTSNEKKSVAEMAAPAQQPGVYSISNIGAAASIEKQVYVLLRFTAA
jgi:hypothetical protein